MNTMHLALGLAVFMFVLVLMLALTGGLRAGTAPASARLRQRLHHAAAPPPAAPSIARQRQLADAPLLRRWLARFAFSAAVERLLAQAGMRIKVAPFLLLSLGLACALETIRQRPTGLLRAFRAIGGNLTLIVRCPLCILLIGIWLLLKLIPADL